MSRQSGSPSDRILEIERTAGSPYKAGAGPGMGQSEIDLNERLNLARKNSKSVGALVPASSGADKLATRSVTELRGQVEARETTELAEDALREAREFGFIEPYSPQYNQARPRLSRLHSPCACATKRRPRPVSSILST